MKNFQKKIQVHSIPASLLNKIPEKIEFEILYNCNLACDYCYLGQGKNRKDQIAKYELAVKIIDRLSSAGITSLQMFGGEPTLHPDIDRLVEYARAIKIPDVGILTNGMCKDVNKIRLLGENCDWIHLTFRGSNQETFDNHTKVKGSFECAIDTLKVLSNTATFIGIEYDCCSDNFTQLESLAEILIEKHDIRLGGIWGHRMLPRGSGSDEKQLQLSLEGFEQVLKQCKKIEERYNIHCKIEDCLPLCLFDEPLREYITPCKGGFITAYIDPKGNVRRCAASIHNFGNILNQSLEEMWLNSELMQHFRSLRWIPYECKICTKLSKCHGGCSVSSCTTKDHTPDVFSPLFNPI